MSFTSMAAQFRDYYETLGVTKGSTADDIKSSFRKLARKHHPDLAKDKKAAEEKFKEINEAYEVLSDPEKRKKYDEYGANWQHAGNGFGGGHPGGAGGRGAGGGFGGFPGGGNGQADANDFHFGGTGYSDFFEQFFGTRRGRGYGGGVDFEETPQRGRDVEADILVTLDEMIHGATRQISFRKGDSPQIQTYTVKIPKGVREGQRIRLAGQGGGGGAHGESGDLYLRVKIQQHPDFRFEGSDIHHELEVPPWKAVLGGEVTIPTPDGRAKLKLPPGTQSGRKFRIPDRGLPEKGGSRGDFYAIVEIAIPESITPEERTHWEALSKSG
ncbi:MAG: J domain-containing protein [bacterium]